MGSAEVGGDHQLRQSQEDQARLRDEQIRLQSVMIEMLNTQLRACRTRIDRQVEEIAELKRLLRVRDDLLYLRGQSAGERTGGPWRWLDRLRSKRG